jgi:phosphoglycolate phosphatase-like HAD superfamily hydrolase
VPDLAPSHILVVGDTPHDIACARAAGAVAVAVATGSFTADELGEHGADIVFDDLSARERFLELLD